MTNIDILITEDGKSQRDLLKDFLKEEGYQILEAENGQKAIEQVMKHHIDLVLLDYKMPGMNGMETLKAIKDINPEIDVIMMTAFGTIDSAVNAMKCGAVDYITKPIELEELTNTIKRIADHRVLIRENEILRKELREKNITTEEVIYKSSAMEEIINLAGRVASSDATVLIQGESGTGKELIARLIHTFSPRSDRPMITVNCAALSENLLESEIFGHEKGAFTGATQKRTGRFEEADKSTLFLDEIGDFSLSVQVKLLRFLQEREFQRVGGTRTITSDVRIISATNKNLEQRVREGKFREDLYYRLNVVSMTIPPLKERKSDIPCLVDHFISKFATRNNKKVNGTSKEARDLLLKYDFPGNVRELENIIERAMVITRDHVITVRDLPFIQDKSNFGQNGSFDMGTLNDSVEALEKHLIQKAMNTTSNHQSKAAELLGISERVLRYKLKKYDLK